MGNSESIPVADKRYPNGSVYNGDMYGNKRHGQGTLTWPDGASYTGAWNNDMCEGYGMMKFPNGSVYEGNFVRNNPYGQGKLTTIHLEILEGFWEFHGRSGQTNTPVGKYQFNGTLTDLKSGEKRLLVGPLALYLLSGLVSLPNMPDPNKAMLPFAEVVGAIKVGSQVKVDKYDESVKTDKYEDVVPVASAVQEVSSISYGKAEPAFRERHPDDHGAVNALDPRVYMASVGLPVYPENVNAGRQVQIRAEMAQYDAQNRG